MTTPPIRFFVPGVPATQGSKRHVGGGVMVDMCKTLKQWRRSVGAACLAEMNQRGRDTIAPGVPVHMDVCFVFQRPAGHFGKRGLRPSAPAWPTGTRDLDKLLRAIFDALSKKAYRDDGQVVRACEQKRYAHQGETPGVLVIVSVIEPD